MCWGVTIVSTRSGAQSGINRSLVNEKQLSFGANLDSGLGSYGALTSAAPVNGIQSESMLRYETKQGERLSSRNNFRKSIGSQNYISSLAKRSVTFEFDVQLCAITLDGQGSPTSMTSGGRHLISDLLF